MLPAEIVARYPTFEHEGVALICGDCLEEWQVEYLAKYYRDKEAQEKLFYEADYENI